MIAIRGGSGLGDALYVQAVARYLIAQGYLVEACCNWPEVFAPLGDKVRVTGFRRQSIDRLAHYSMRRRIAESSQWEDVCAGAGIPTDTELKLDWNLKSELADRVRYMAGDRPLIVLGMPRAPFARIDGYGLELLPTCVGMQQVIASIDYRAFIVQVGLGQRSFELNGIDLDLVNRTSVSDLFSLVAMCEAVIGQPSYLIPLAESLNKPGLFIWSQAGRVSQHEVIRNITPSKIIHRKDLLRSVYDDETVSKVNEICRSFPCSTAA